MNKEEVKDLINDMWEDELSICGWLYMETRLKPNMYVRIQWGNGEQTISKCTNKVDMGNTQYSNDDFYIHTDKKGEVIYKSMILKASHNIIDLIEVGDYVNGSCIIDIKSKYEIGKGLKAMVGKYLHGLNKPYFYIREQDIKSVVTKEQFESIECAVDNND